ncbi:MAG: ABC transporter permease [Bacteroidetes bacterium]|nr:MAG: ABC transporter permease [Bacteroidota bacterium]
MIFGKKKIQRHLRRAESGSIPPPARGLFWRRFKKNKMARWSLRVLWGLVFVAIMSPFLANEKPLWCRYAGESYFPVFKGLAVETGQAQWPPVFQNKNWHDLEYEAAIWPPVRWSGHTMDLKTGNFEPPGKSADPAFPHYLGTGNLGRDVLAGLIEGTRTALLVGIVAMAIAGFIGILAGGVAGYFGDHGLKVSRGRLWLNILAVPTGIFYAFFPRTLAFAEGHPGMEILKSLGIVLFTFLVFNALVPALKKVDFFRKRLTIPADLLVMRVIEIMNAIPGLLLLLAAVALLRQPSVFYVMILIGLIAWTGIARFLRAELLRVRNLTYIEAARATGLTEFQILWRHALPNAMGPVLISLAFGMAASILLESTLSFLNIGTSDEVMSWGKLLAHARQHETAWWLAVFPGLAIFVTVTIFNLIGEGLSDALDRKADP